MLSQRKELKLKKEEDRKSKRPPIGGLFYYRINFLYFIRFGIKSPPNLFFLFSS